MKEDLSRSSDFGLDIYVGIKDKTIITSTSKILGLLVCKDRSHLSKADIYIAQIKLGPVGIFAGLHTCSNEEIKHTSVKWL